jgi:hypothetical protein
VATSKVRPRAIRLHDQGEVWNANARLAVVLYQLRVQDEQERSILALVGTLLPDGPGWQFLEQGGGDALWLRLRDGRRVKFAITTASGSILHIRGVIDL